MSAPQTARVLQRTCRSRLTAAAPSKRSLSSQCLRISSNQRLQQTSNPQRRYQSTDAAAPVNPKISGIVDQISTLTLLETADLVQSLKSRLNIPDISFAPPSGAGGPAAAAAPIEEEEAAAPAAVEKSLFNIKLVSFDASAKAKVIKEVKALLGLSLVDSKKFVESAPKMLKEGAVKDEAEKIKTTMEALGAKVEVD